MAGYIHRVEGDAFLDGKEIHPKPTDFLHVMRGQKLKIGEGRSEILIIPGSFIRLGEGAEIEMVRPGLTSTTIRLLQGPAVLDLEAIFEPDSIAIEIGDSTITFPKPGLYRFDSPDELRVLSGRARIVTESGKESTVKAKRLTRLASGGSAQKLEGDGPEDGLAAWQTERHQTLAAIADKEREEQIEGMSKAERAIVRMLLYSEGQPNRPSSGSSMPSGGGQTTSRQ